MFGWISKKKDEIVDAVESNDSAQGIVSAIPGVGDDSDKDKNDSNTDHAFNHDNDSSEFLGKKEDNSDETEDVVDNESADDVVNNDSDVSDNLNSILHEDEETSAEDHYDDETSTEDHSDDEESEEETLFEQPREEPESEQSEYKGNWFGISEIDQDAGEQPLNEDSGEEDSLDHSSSPDDLLTQNEDSLGDDGVEETSEYSEAMDRINDEIEEGHNGEDDATASSVEDEEEVGLYEDDIPEEVDEQRSVIPVQDELVYTSESTPINDEGFSAHNTLVSKEVEEDFTETHIFFMDDKEIIDYLEDKHDESGRLPDNDSDVVINIAYMGEDESQDNPIVSIISEEDNFRNLEIMGTSDSIDIAKTLEYPDEKTKRIIFVVGADEAARNIGYEDMVETVQNRLEDSLVSVVDQLNSIDGLSVVIFTGDENANEFVSNAHHLIQLVNDSR